MMRNAKAFRKTEGTKMAVFAAIVATLSIATTVLMVKDNTPVIQ